MKKYRPSNGTEGEMFMERFCYRCTKFDEYAGCNIQMMTFLLDEKDSDYPEEWTCEDDGSNARCIAFNVPPQDTETLPLFPQEGI